MTRIVALYIRTSTENQRESIRLQTEELTSYSKSHNYEIYEKYIDFGVSGSTTERPALTNLFEDAKAHKFDMVLVTKIDRFARSILDCLFNIKNLKNMEYNSQPLLSL